MDNFERIDSYKAFCEEVKSTNRHFLSEKALDFLESLLSHAKQAERVVTFDPHVLYFRARKGVAEEQHIQIHEKESGEEVEYVDSNFCARNNASDYFPLSDYAGCGRANPEGIPYLYVAMDPKTAISEVRPNVGEPISVATLYAKKPMKIANFTDKESFHFARYSKETASNLSEEKTMQLVFEKVSNAFAKPIDESKSAMDYLPTQIISEYFRNSGFDGIGYRSQFEVCEFDEKRDEGDGEKSIDPKRSYNTVFFDKENFYAKEAKIYHLRKTISFISCEKDPKTKSFFHSDSLIDVEKIRKNFNLEQGVFAYRIGADYRDLVNWEKGIGKPSSSHLKILRMLEENPEATMAMLKKS